MVTRAKIALRFPVTNETDKYFTLRLKPQLFNEHCEHRQPSKLLVMAGIEGNFNTLCSILIHNKVIDSNFRWKFGEGHLVIVGNCFNQGDEAVECLWLLYALEERAIRKGGYVHYILGHNELLHLNGSWRYRQPSYASNVKTSNAGFMALYDGNSELWRWLRTKNALEIIGDTLFVHGGISPSVNEEDLSIAEINELIRSHYLFAGQPIDDPKLHMVINSDQSPFRYRGYVLGLAGETLVNATLSKFKVATIVTGNAVGGGINSYFNGKVFNIDSNNIDNQPVVLFVKKSKFYKVDSQGDTEKLIRFGSINHYHSS